MQSLQLSPEHIRSMELAFETEATHETASALRPVSNSGEPFHVGNGAAASRVGSRAGSRTNSLGPPISRGRGSFSPNTSLLSPGGGGSAYESALTAPNISVSANGLPPVFTHHKKSKLSTGFNRKTIVQLDPYVARDGNWRSQLGSSAEFAGPESTNISVMKSAKHCLQLNRSFRQTAPKRFVAK